VPLRGGESAGGNAGYGWRIPGGETQQLSGRKIQWFTYRIHINMYTV
jgi:hypothetical protein